MRNPVTDTLTELVDLRRRQLATVADALQATLDLEEIAQQQAVSHRFADFDELLTTATDEIQRAAWQALMDRIPQPIPSLEDE